MIARERERKRGGRRKGKDTSKYLSEYKSTQGCALHTRGQSNNGIYAFI
jgi:hypothetical protein